MLFFGLVGKKPSPVEPQMLASAPVPKLLELIEPVSAVDSTVDLPGELIALHKRMYRLEELWKSRAQDFPYKSPVYNDFMALAKQVRVIYEECVSFHQVHDDQAEVLAAIKRADEAITALAKSEINKRTHGEKPIHRLIRQQAEKPESEAKHKERLDTLIAEGAKVSSKTRVYRRSWKQVLFDVLKQFPFPRKMYRAYINNPKRSVFEMSHSTDSLQKSMREQGLKVPAQNPASPLTVTILVRVKHVIDYFSSPSKFWIEKPNASSPIARLIGFHEELMGQMHLQEVHQYLIEKDKTIIGNFFRIISEHKRSVEPDRFKRLNTRLERFFGQLGISNISEVFLNIETLLTEEDLRNSLEIQILYYLLAYVYKVLNVSKNGKIVEKYEQDYDQQIERCLKLLEKVEFSPAYLMHIGLNTVDDRKVQELNLKGAFLGNRQCQYALCEKYLSFIAGNLSVANPPEFVFPLNVTHDLLMDWASKARQVGYTHGLANMQNFMDNFFGAAGALYQEGISPAQKEAIKKMGEVVKAISGDKAINQLVDTIVSLKEGEKNIVDQYKAARQAATEYLTEAYRAQFKRTNQSVDLLLTSALMQNMFERHAVFQLLTHVEQELRNEEARLKAKNSDTAQAYVFPISRMQDLKQDLLTETEDLRFMHRNDPAQVMIEAEMTLGNLYRAVKTDKDISANHISSMKSIKHKFGKYANAVLPESLAVRVQPSSAVKSSYDLYQAARRINEGKSSALETPRRTSSKKLKLGQSQHGK